jgi:hypothetical protein
MVLKIAALSDYMPIGSNFSDYRSPTNSIGVTVGLLNSTPTY